MTKWYENLPDLSKEKPPCDDCRVRIAGNCPEDPIALTNEVRDQISDSLEWRLFFPNKPIAASTSEVGDALDRCDHWHRWGRVVGLTEYNIEGLKKLKAHRKNPPVLGEYMD